MDTPGGRTIIEGERKKKRNVRAIATGRVTHRRSNLALVSYSADGLAQRALLRRGVGYVRRASRRVVDHDDDVGVQQIDGRGSSSRILQASAAGNSERGTAQSEPGYRL